MARKQKRRGRPLGSKNKPKRTARMAGTVEALPVNGNTTVLDIAPAAKSATAEQRQYAMDKATGIVTEQVKAHQIAPADVEGRIKSLSKSILYGLVGITNGNGEGAQTLSKTPVIDPRKSVTPEYIVCLFDGMKLKTLKRHLRVSFGMTTDDYKRHFGLPHDYPTVAPSYSKKRSRLAKSFGLGQKG